MSSHDVTVTGFALIFASLIGIDLAARTRLVKAPTFGQVMTRIMRTRTGRVGILLAWAWLGLHFFAR